MELTSISPVPPHSPHSEPSFATRRERSVSPSAGKATRLAGVPSQSEVINPAEPDPDTPMQFTETSSVRSGSSKESGGSLRKGKAKLKAVAESVVSKVKKGTASLAGFFPKISRSDWERQEKRAWAVLAEERARRVEEEAAAKELKAAEKREFDKIRQREYRASKRKANELEENTRDNGGAARTKVRLIWYSLVVIKFAR